MKRNTRLTKEEEDFIIECYQPLKTSLRDVEKLCGISRKSIKKVLIKYGIEIIPKQRTYPTKEKDWKVCGVGINDADYKFEIREYETVNGKRSSRLVWMCPYYSSWSSMIRRCYSSNREDTSWVFF